MNIEEKLVFTLKFADAWDERTLIVRMFEKIMANRKEYRLSGFVIHRYFSKKEFTIPLSNKIGKSILSEIKSINISLIPPDDYVLDGEKYNLIIGNLQHKIEINWASVPQGGWEQLDYFINLIKKHIPNDENYEE